MRNEKLFLVKQISDMIGNADYVYFISFAGLTVKDFSELRNQVACAIGDSIPTVLRPEQQSYFALGYYQMCSKINKERLARIAAVAGKKSD